MDKRNAYPYKQRHELIAGNCRELVVRQMADSLFKAQEYAGMFRHCLNCRFWQDASPYTGAQDLCTKFQQLPPPKVLVSGCEYHEDNIPF